MISAFSGLLLSFYFNPRQIWAIIIHRENETVLYIAGKSDRFQFADEFETLVERIQAGFPKAG
jgi:cytochrome c biogenesis protein ResB